MVNTLKNEIKRSFYSKSFLISIIISGALVLWYSFERLSYCIEFNNTFPHDKTPGDFFEISYTNWIGSHNMILQQNIFYLIIPFLATLPFAGSFFADIHHGYIKGICTRTKKSHYLLSKYISVFLSGGTAVVIPMLLSLLISSAFLPAMIPESSYAYTNIFSSNKWADLLFAHPLLYIFLYTAVVFVFSGLTACMSLAITYFSYKSFLALIFPFFVYIFVSLFVELVNLESFSVRNLLTTTDEHGTTLSVIIMAVLFFVFSFFPYYFMGVKKDVL